MLWEGYMRGWEGAFVLTIIKRERLLKLGDIIKRESWNIEEWYKGGWKGWQGLDQGSRNYKVSIFSSRRCIVCPSYLTFIVAWKQITEWARMCSNKTLFTKQVAEDMVHRAMVCPCLGYIIQGLLSMLNVLVFILRTK